MSRHYTQFTLLRCWLRELCSLVYMYCTPRPFKLFLWIIFGIATPCKTEEKEDSTRYMCTNTKWEFRKKKSMTFSEKKYRDTTWPKSKEKSKIKFPNAFMGTESFKAIWVEALLASSPDFKNFCMALRHGIKHQKNSKELTFHRRPSPVSVKHSNRAIVHACIHNGGN